MKPFPQFLLGLVAILWLGISLPFRGVAEVSWDARKLPPPAPRGQGVLPHPQLCKLPYPGLSHPAWGTSKNEAKEGKTGSAGLVVKGTVLFSKHKLEIRGEWCRVQQETQLCNRADHQNASLVVHPSFAP